MSYRVGVCLGIRCTLAPILAPEDELRFFRPQAIVDPLESDGRCSQTASNSLPPGAKPPTREASRLSFLQTLLMG